MERAPVRIADFIAHGLARAGQRLQLLALLGALYGIFYSLLSYEANQALEAVFSAMESEDETAATSAVSQALQDGLPAILWAHISSTALFALIAIPWARAMAPGGLLPLSGGFPALLRRALRAFWHLLLASVLIAMALLLMGLVLFILTSSLGFLPGVLVFAGAIVFIWITITVSAIANYAVLMEAQDLPMTLQNAVAHLVPTIAPATASFALFWMVATIVYLTIAGLVGPETLGFTRVLLAISGMLTFSASAIHIAALSNIPFAIEKSD